MPGQVLHSGEYWQMLRRRKAEREARQATNASVVPADSIAYTFVPGRSTPIVGVVRANGTITPTPSSSSSTQSTPTPSKRTHRPTRSIVTSNSILASRARDDEILLARLHTSSSARRTPMPVAPLATTSAPFMAPPAPPKQTPAQRNGKRKAPPAGPAPKRAKKRVTPPGYVDLDSSD
ncbi:hypothetical protein B0H11DRAFT_2265903 [Mycena galericulata]|nr:hypothetical protein B0H11DRAFT_2265903 [Mycena galericulata]